MTHFTVLERTRSTTQARSVGPVLVTLAPVDGGGSAISMAHWFAERRHADLQAISMIEGTPGSTVASVAADRHASAIVIGTGRHGMLGRFLYGERALEVVRGAECPVLVVPPYVEPPITRAMVAVDFSQASKRAALSVLEILDPGSDLTLVHVQRAARHVNGQAHRTLENDERRKRDLFSRFLDALPASVGVQIQTVTLRGDAVGALLRYAEEQEVQLIACGRRRRSITERPLVGSVSTALIRGAPCSVIVAPERLGDDEPDVQLALVTSAS